MRSLQGNAALLAATEIAPAEWRDLSEALELCGGPDGLTSEHLAGDSTRESRFVAWLRSNLAPNRVEHWERVLRTLSETHPDTTMIDVTADEYPQMLRDSFNRPPFLFVSGKRSLAALRQPMVAVVGARSPSSGALMMAREVSNELARLDCTVVSGLAAGIDSAAHQAALEASAFTVAVLGSGIDADPRLESDRMAVEIRRTGAVVSQFRPGSPATRSSYPLRNAVISGLSRASVVLEASERSGTRSEIDHALAQGRYVRLWSSMSAAPWARNLVAFHDRAAFFDTPEEAVRGVVG